MINLTHNIILSFLNNNNLIAIKNQILEINDKSVDYGLVLSPKDVEEVIKSRKDSLKTYGRIDLNMDITEKIMEILYTSQYTDKDDYPELINDLQDIFYYLKNETLDEISDNEILDKISEFYEKTSGRIDNVQNLAEKFANDYRLKRVSRDE